MSFSFDCPGDFCLYLTTFQLKNMSLAMNFGN